jgi:CBS domain containing-hemolysin-like protein
MSEGLGSELLVALATAALLVGAQLAVLAALLERSGPIRLRHWAQETAGATVRALYQQPRRFEAYRFALSLLARVLLTAFFGLLAAWLAVLAVQWPLLWAFVAFVAVVAAVDVLNRHLVGSHPEEALRGLSGIFRLLAVLLAPLLPLIAPLLPTPEDEEEDDDEEDEEASRAAIEAFIDVGRREGILEAEEGELVRGLVAFAGTQVRSVMTPRIDMVCAPLDASPQQVAELVLASGHTRIPVYRDSVDEIVGILHVRDLLRALLRNGQRPLADLLQPPHVVPETKVLIHLLRELQQRHQEVAIVVDEYGGTLGMVTIEDLLEEIFGEIGDTPDEADVVQLADGAWRVAGRTRLDELAERLGVDLDEELQWETAGGLTFGQLGHVPRVGDSVEAYGLRFTVEAADHRRARRLRVERVGAPVGGGDLA